MNLALAESMSKFRQISANNNSKRDAQLHVISETGSIFLTGPLIDADSLINAMQKQNPKKAELVIDNVMGRPHEFVKLVKYMNTNDVKLVVDGRCFNACASILFLGIKNKQVIEKSLIAFQIHDPAVTELLRSSDAQIIWAESERKYLTKAFSKTYLGGVEQKRVCRTMKYFLVKGDELKGNGVHADHRKMVSSSDDFQLFAEQFDLNKNDFYLGDLEQYKRNCIKA